METWPARSRFSVKLDRTCRIPPGICGLDVVGNAYISARIALTDAGPLLGLTAARLLTIEGAPAKDVRARMTGTCGRSCQAVGSFFAPDRRAKTCPCYKCNPAACRAGNKAVPEAGRGGGTCSPASENIR